MNFDEKAKLYLNDTKFHTTVDLLYSLLLEGNHTVQELQDACLFAGYKFEMERIRPYFTCRKV